LDSGPCKQKRPIIHKPTLKMTMLTKTRKSLDIPPPYR
jgi:hypothetical protein